MAIGRLTPVQSVAGRSSDIVEWQAVHHAQPHPIGEAQDSKGSAEPLPQPPEAGRLPRERGAGAHPGEPLGPVCSETLVCPIVAMKSKELPNYFHCNDLRISQPGAPAPFPELFRIFFHKVVWNTVDRVDLFLNAHVRGSFLMSCVTFIKVVSHAGSSSGVMCFFVDWP